MLSNIKSEIHTEVTTDVLEKHTVTSLGAINQEAANSPKTDQNSSMQRRLRRQSRSLRNRASTTGLWRVSMW